MNHREDLDKPPRLSPRAASLCGFQSIGQRAARATALTSTPAGT
jgi:hypothetical protein